MTQSNRRWLSLLNAAHFLDTTPEALRKLFERHSRRAPDGGIEAHVDGVIGRKFGRVWRVAFSERWLSPCSR
jgi:hypothetical protein